MRFVDKCVSALSQDELESIFKVDVSNYLKDVWSTPYAASLGLETTLHRQNDNIKIRTSLQEQYKPFLKLLCFSTVALCFMGFLALRKVQADNLDYNFLFLVIMSAFVTILVFCSWGLFIAKQQNEAVEKNITSMLKSE